MNIREQLDDLLKRCKWNLEFATNPALPIDESIVSLIEKLIAERPYEPGERVMHDGDHCYFYCVSPHNEAVYIVRVLNDGGLYRVLAAHVSPIPKTRRLKPVPVEVINDAKEAQKAFGLVAHGSPSEVKGFKALKWLANPENYEDD